MPIIIKKPTLSADPIFLSHKETLSDKAIMEYLTESSNDPDDFNPSPEVCSSHTPLDPVVDPLASPLSHMGTCHSPDCQQTKEALNHLRYQIPDVIAHACQEVKQETIKTLLQAIEPLFLEQQKNKSYAIEQIKKLLLKIKSTTCVTIKMHPSDLAAFKKGLGQQTLGQQTMAPMIQWVADTDLIPGGYIILTKQGAFNASIEHQLEALKQRLMPISTPYNSHEMYDE